MALENLTNSTLLNSASKRKKRNNSDLNESPNEAVDTPIKKSKLDLSTIKSVNEHEATSSSLESITIISSDDDDHVDDESREDSPIQLRTMFNTDC